MAADRSVVVRLMARTEQFQAQMTKAGVTTKTLGSQVDSLGTRGAAQVSALTNGFVNMSGKAALATGAVAVAGAAAIKFVMSSVDAWTQLVEKVDQYQDVTGASAEESSKMVAIADAFGVSTDTLAGSMFRLARNVEANQAGFRRFGIEVTRNADGSVDLTRTLGNVAEAYQRVGGGQAGARVAQEAFGRGGAALIDILERQQSELDAVTAAAERHGRIVSDDDIDKVREYRVATAQLGDAWGELGRQVAIGAVPALTQLADALAGAGETATDAAEPFGGVGNILEAAFAKLTGQYAGVFPILADGHEDAADAATAQAEAELALADAAEEAATQLATYQSVLAGLRDEALLVRGVQDEFNAELVDFADTVMAAKESGDQFASSLDDTTSSGLANREMLAGLVDRAFAIADAMAVQGKSQDQVAIAMANHRDQIIATLTALGFTEAQVRAYVDVLLRVPTNVATEITADTAQAENALSRVLALLGAIQRSEGMTNLNVLSGRTTPTVGQGPVPGGAGSALADALAGLGPLATGVKESNASAAASGAASAANEAERQRAEWIRAQDAFHRNMHEHDMESLDDYRAYLDMRLAQETEGSAAWFAILDERERVLEQHASDVEKWNDALARNAEEAAARQREAEDIQFREGRLSNDEYKAILMGRHADMVEAHGYWSAEAESIRDELRGIDEKVADDAERASKEQERRQDEALSRLRKLLDDERKIRDRLAETTRQHHERLADLNRRFNDDQGRVLDQRREQLFGWADANERVRVSWGNTVSSLTGNLRDQLGQFTEWARLLDEARSRGVSTAVVDMLGLAEGPQALGQLRMFSSATQAEIDALNAAVEARTAAAGDQVGKEAGQSFSKVGGMLRDLAEKHAAEVEKVAEEFLARQRELTDELAMLGMDQGLKYTEAVAAGLRSGLPGVESAARDLAAALGVGARRLPLLDRTKELRAAEQPPRYSWTVIVDGKIADTVRATLRRQNTASTISKGR